MAANQCGDIFTEEGAGNVYSNKDVEMIQQREVGIQIKAVTGDGETIDTMYLKEIDSTKLHDWLDMRQW